MVKGRWDEDVVDVGGVAHVGVEGGWQGQVCGDSDKVKVLHEFPQNLPVVVLATAVVGAQGRGIHQIPTKLGGSTADDAKVAVGIAEH